MATLIHPTVRPRSLAQVLADIREAFDDYQDALTAIRLDDPDGHDRATEAGTRLDDLRDEFAAKFVEATGLSVDDFRAAYAGALI